MQTKWEEERQLASQHQLALQAQASEAQAHVKVCIITTHPVAVSAVYFPATLSQSVCYYTSFSRCSDRTQHVAFFSYHHLSFPLFIINEKCQIQSFFFMYLTYDKK